MSLKKPTQETTRVGVGLAGWSGVPPVLGEGLADEASGDDDRVGPGDECLDHPGPVLGALMETLTVSNIHHR